MTRITPHHFSVLIVAILAVFTYSPAKAEWPERPIRFVVPFSPGGGFDSFARAFQPYLENELGVEVVIDNITGAGGLRGATTVFKAEPDGYTIGLFNLPSFAYVQLTDPASAVDLDSIAWIANLSSERHSVAVSANSQINSIEDLCNLGRPAKLSGAGDTSYAAAGTVMGAFDCPYSIVSGYRGGTEMIMATIRGEVDATITGTDSLLEFVQSGDSKIILTVGAKSELPDVPSTGDYGKSQLDDVMIARLVGAPPGTDPTIVERLSAAFASAAASPDLIAWSERTNRRIDYADANGASKIVAAQFTYLKNFLANSAK